MSIDNLINMLADNKDGQAKEVFNTIMSDKVNNALDTKKIQIASQLTEQEETHMKKITLSEAATRVVMNLPQEDLSREDLHEALGNREMKKVVSYLESFLKNTGDFDKEEAQKMYKLCTDEIDDMVSYSINWHSPIQGLFIAQWATLWNALDAIVEGDIDNSSKTIVKRHLALLKTIAKIKV